MTKHDPQFATVTELLKRAGYTLDTHQPHIIGERFLMQNLTTASGGKYILIGEDQNHTPVVIKVATDAAGREELAYEKACRSLLKTIEFAYEPFFTPEELVSWNEDAFSVSVQAYIDQPQTFLSRAPEEQFRLALGAFKNQESARATTSSHYRTVAKTYGIRTAADYVRLAKQFIATLQEAKVSETILATTTDALHRLESEHERIQQYCGFLTHTDFVPHNFRIKDGTMYLLDCASFQFANKHESWARFLNFMVLYNHKLEQQLVTYVEKNRAPEERESLQLMRLYRLIEIITYYVSRLPQSDGDLHTLNQARVEFWHSVLQSELKNERVPRITVEEYRIARDRLRTEDEKKRQEQLH